MFSAESWPPQGSGKRRSVRYEQSWEESRQRVEADARRFDEICEAINWWMENAADGCVQLADSPFRLARAIDPDGAMIRALFTINSDEQVSAWYVDRVEGSEEEDSS